jgi:Cu(I)/Ag(I) efflux system membrane fusion protein
LYLVNAKISGWIEKLYINFVGAEVTEGDPLLEIYSPELVSTQEEYLLAYRNIEKISHIFATRCRHQVNPSFSI